MSVNADRPVVINNPLFRVNACANRLANRMDRFIIPRQVHNTAVAILGWTSFVHLLFSVADDGRPDGRTYRIALNALELTCLAVIVVVRVFFPVRNE